MVPLPEIVTNIASRVEYVSQFRCVSKAWYALLKTPHFILTHLRHALENHNLLLLRSNNSDEGIDLTIFSGEVAAPQGQLDFPGIDINIHRSRLRVEGSSDGLLLLGLTRCCAPLELLLFNPTIRRLRSLPAFPIAAPTGSTRSSFCLGFDPASNDYKVISFLNYFKFQGFCDFMHEDEEEDMDANVEAEDEEDVAPPPIRAEIFSLKSGRWEELPACVVPPAYYDATPAVALNGSFYWLGNALEEVEGDSFLLSFHMNAQIFTKTPMPGSGAYSVRMRKLLNVYNDSLAIIFYPYFDKTETIPIDLWVMKDNGDGGVSSWSWTKLYSFGPFIDVEATRPLGVCKNQIIIQFGENNYNNGVFSYNCETTERKYLVTLQQNPQMKIIFIWSACKCTIMLRASSTQSTGEIDV